MDQCIASRIGKGLGYLEEKKNEGAPVDLVIQPSKHQSKKLHYISSDDEEQEPSLHLDFQLMVHNSALSNLIKETATIIEENMLSPHLRQIDMSLIESIKQRRKDQREALNTTSTLAGEDLPM
jgi:hypothetical protein